jgi:hypothetical protein
MSIATLGRSVNLKPAPVQRTTTMFDATARRRPTNFGSGILPNPPVFRAPASFDDTAWAATAFNPPAESYDHHVDQLAMEAGWTAEPEVIDLGPVVITTPASVIEPTLAPKPVVNRRWCHNAIRFLALVEAGRKLIVLDSIPVPTPAAPTSPWDTTDRLTRAVHAHVRCGCCKGPVHPPVQREKGDYGYRAAPGGWQCYRHADPPWKFLCGGCVPTHHDSYRNTTRSTTATGGSCRGGTDGWKECWPYYTR